jgi:DNA-binding response OmpR family regulator/CBS domain-containing protein
MATDRAMLRRATRVLTVFGYRVRALSDLSQANRILEAEVPDVLLLDGAADRERTLDLCRQAGCVESSHSVYRLLFVDDITPAEVTRCLEAGIDDFLGRPLEHGELLARLRTAARVLEFERRVSGIMTGDHSQTLDRPEFLTQVATVLTQARTARRPVACLCFEIDYADAVEAASGRRAAQTLQRQLLLTIKQCATDCLAIGQLNNRRIAVLVRKTAAESVTLAENLRETFAAWQASIEAHQPSVTVSCGIADNASQSLSADDLVGQSESSLLVAQSSGGDYAAYFGQFADEEQKWSDLAKNGGLFENTLARDIMVPCTVAIEAKSPLAQAAALFEQTQLQALPVVDDEGKLAGLLTAATVRLRLTADDSANEPVACFMTSDMASFDERTSVPALVDYFTQESPLAIVIVHKGRPTGLVTPSSLATLSEQLTTTTFVETVRPSHRRGLIVSNLCGMDS